MTEIVSLQNVVRLEKCVLTVGTFDGVHAGHRSLIRFLTDIASRETSGSTIVTFDPHPREIIHPDGDKISLLTTLSERAKLLGDLGVERLVVIPFDRDFSLLDSENFIRKIIWGKIGVSHFVIGYDHHFGKDRSGSVETVKQLGQEFGFKTSVFPKQELGEAAVSSTRIRKILSESGDMQQVTELLGRQYTLSGTVVKGDGRGRMIGFPTANIRLDDSRKQIPKQGVYAVKIRVEDKWMDGMMNIGMRPTFSGREQSIEVHLFDFSESLYGQTLTIEFYTRIRDEKNFPSVEDLIKQLTTDQNEVKCRMKMI